MVLRLDDDKTTRDGELLDDSSIRSAPSKARIISRLNFFRIGIIGGFSLLGWRLWDLQVNKPPEARQEATKANVRDLAVKAPRGIIYDRSGKPLVNNIASYSVTITRFDLPARLTEKGKQALIKDGKPVIDSRQLVYDNLARFLGMNYVVAVIPNDVLKSQQRNAILNTLEGYIQISAVDLEKRLLKRQEQKLGDSVLVLKDKIPLSEFNRMLPLRDLTGSFFLSQAERIMLESEFRTADFEPVVVWPNISREDANILDEKRLELPGVGILSGYVRQYEKPNLFAHILGYTNVFRDNQELDAYNAASNGNVNNIPTPAANTDSTSFARKVYSIDDSVGRQGIEASMEDYLRGQKGGRAVRVDNAGNIVDTVPGSEKKPIVGHSIYLTIDPKIQDAATTAILEEIENARKKKQATSLTGAAVVMDVETGEVLALVSLPTFNNNLFRPNLSDEEDKQLAQLFVDESTPLINRAIQGLYAPGSTFKLITALAGLNEGNLNLGTTFDCRQFIYVPATENGNLIRTPFKCWGNHGTLNVEGAIQQSCDIFFYNSAQDPGSTTNPLRYFTDPASTNPIYFRGMGINKLIKYMQMFGLGKPTGIELPGEYDGLLQTPETYPKYHLGGAWSLGDTIVTAIGQGDTQMTPLQVCNVTATIANGGTVIKPRIVQKVVDVQGNTIVPDEKVIVNPIEVSQTHLATVKRGMRKVTLTGGTAESVMANQMGNLTVAGKTGTAEYGEAYGKDDKGRPLFPTLAWFTCFAPYDKPKYAVTTLITTAENQIEGSTFAVPAARKILQVLFPQETGVNNAKKP